MLQRDGQTDVRPYACVQCSCRFTRSSPLEGHQRRAHQTTLREERNRRREELCLCVACGFVCENYATLLQHTPNSHVFLHWPCTPLHIQMTCPTAQRTFMKDLQQLYRTIEASTDGQAFIVGIDEMSVKVSLRPKSGYNAHAEFMLTIKCHSAYPNIRPDVSFDSPIFHPNVDPSTGSVCVSLLNEWQRPRLTGVLWMMPLDALSPFYHVPIPLREERKDSEDDGCEEGDGVYPTPTCLRFLTITAFLTNWVAWLSRMEGYAALGMSRFHPMLISAPVAACLLQPFSLGCGQTPLLDLWPMWVLRRLLTLSLKLPQLQIPFLHHSRQRLQCLFPFSDLDEI
ncbi:NEDD8-conjugating enzyme Ubc12 [Echinococcus granulosus]|uniref:NEDD8-conjugating enzyme Ubc12 n=1 Tax=Echinococcus granulosus TaxID=6210 RepID=W6UMV3_ECHGR|nr:NEDD8-conjugating enzyme Ubc12 [Echinococcus granulosus]EUB54824.1 NEDD8-conjugating enzyme Ubc12 [Echinococcus granulosus]